MKIVEWNVNQRANHINTEDLPPFIAQALWGEDPDFFILTECYKVKHLQDFIDGMNQYNVFVSDNSCHHQNEIVIGVRKSFEGAKMISSMESGVENNNPNFLHVAVEIDHRVLNIMGVRIRVPKSAPNSSVESQTYRLAQLDILVEKLEFVKEPIVLAGDFNNYRRGLSPATLELKRDPESTKCPLWNMTVLRDRFEELGYEMCTPEGFSFGWANPNLKYQFAQDHAFLKGVTLATNGIDGSPYCYYVDEFMNLAPEIYEKKGIKGVVPPNPDHKMLVVEFDMN